jgi:hypothetical protein
VENIFVSEKREELDKENGKSSRKPVHQCVEGAICSNLLICLRFQSAHYFKRDLSFVFEKNKLQTSKNTTTNSKLKTKVKQNTYSPFQLKRKRPHHRNVVVHRQVKLGVNLPHFSPNLRHLLSGLFLQIQFESKTLQSAKHSFQQNPTTTKKSYTYPKPVPAHFFSHS